MTEAFIENVEENSDVQSKYFQGGYPSHGAEVSQVKPKNLRTEIVARPNDKSSGIL